MKRVMKRIICLFMAVTVILSQPFLVYAAAGEKNLTSSLAGKQELAAEAAIKRANEESMNRVAMNLGRTSSTAIDMSHYLNKKVLHKRELEAFKWSFIFSQFCKPLQDSLDDVFDQSIFKQMDEQDMNIASVSEVLSDKEYMQILDSTGMMLQSTKYKELKKTIKENLYYLTLYDKAGASVTLNDLLSSRCDAGTLFYIYDQVDNTAFSASEMNDLYYNQGKLGDGKTYKLTTELMQIPILTYDNVTFLYLQTAVGSYCREHGIDLNTLKSQKGSGTLYADSYGNICVYDGSDYRMVIPNFGNSIFINEGVTGHTEYDLEERVFQYNKWLSTCYSKRTRESNVPQTEKFTPYILGDEGVTSTDKNQVTTTVYGDGPAHYFAEFLNVSSTNAKKTDQYETDPKIMKGNLIFIDPPTISAAAQGMQWDTLGSTIDTRIKNVAGQADVYTQKTALWGASNTSGTAWWGNVGIVMPPADQTIIGFNPKNGTPVEDKFPFMQGKRELNTAQGGNFWSVPKAFSQILSKGVWKSTDNSVAFDPAMPSTAAVRILDEIGGVIQSSKTYGEIAPTLETINTCYAGVFGWDYNKIIDNPNYVAKATVEDGNWASMMFLKSDLLDYGQTMPVYMQGTEAGMYLPYYRAFYTGSTKNMMNGMMQGLDRIAGNINNNGVYTAGSGMGMFDSVKGIQFKVSKVAPSGAIKDVEKKDLKQRIALLKDVLAGSQNGFAIWKKFDFKEWQSFRAEWDKACEACGLNSDEMLNLVITFQNSSASWDLNGDQMYFMSQWYLLPRDNKYSEKMGCNTSEDFVLSTYFWDRYYLTKTPMNTDFQTEIYENTRDAVGDHAATEWKPHVLQADGTVLDGNGAVVEMAGATTDSVKQFNKQNYYDSLGPDDIVFLSRSELGSHKVKVYYTPQDELFYKATAGGFEGQVIPVNYYRLLMSLQKNTDYAHNYQVLPETSEEAVENVEIQELMNNAEAYLSNPVKIITTILSGLLFDIHRFLAMSSLGSGFDLNWILDSSIYKWVSDRFVVIAILLVCIITLIRVVRYLLMKRQSLGEVLKDLCAVLLMTALPFLMLSSFIYLFNSTSTNILREASFKTTASQIQMKQTERMNADANVDTELALFREQFTSLKGNYDGLTFMMPDTYNYATKELSYQEVPLTGMLENLKLTWDKPVWYDATGFVEVNESHYDESPFYFFYDYIKAMYIEYYAANPKVETSAMKTVAARYNYGEKTLASMSDVEKKDLQLLEQNFATTKGNFRTMMKDTSFVYGNSILKSNKNKYGGPQLRDLFGFYKFFEVPDSSGASAGITNIHNADYFTYMQQSPAMYYSRTVPQGITVGEERTWTNPALIEQYDRGRSWLYTSKLDPFNPAINTDTGRTAPTKYTPFEEALFNTSERIYQDILDTLDYLPDQLTDETLITMSALLATFRLDETFGMSPQTPIMGSLNMDMLMRTTLIKNVVNMDARVNLMYAMLNDGYGFFAILCVIMFEAAMALLTLVRILIMLSIIITAFTYGILRFTFGKVTESKFLVWGIVGNYVAMIGLHFLTALIVNGLVSMMSTMFTGIFWTIAGLILLMIGTAGIAALHIFLFMFILRDFRNLGGVSIKNAFDKTVHDMTAKAENIKSKVGSALSTVGDQIQNVKHAAVRIAEAGQAKIQSIKGATIQTITGNISSLNSAEGNPVSQNFDIDAEQRGPDGSGSMQGYGYSQQRQQNTRMERAEAKAAAREAKVEARAAARAATNSEKISGEDVSLKRAPRKAHKHVDTSSGEFDYSQLYK